MSSRKGGRSELSKAVGVVVYRGVDVGQAEEGVRQEERGRGGWRESEGGDRDSIDGQSETLKLDAWEKYVRGSWKEDHGRVCYLTRRSKIRSNVCGW